jgi:FMNH2-dependent dimethyl sulfone monooxygenase
VLSETNMAEKFKKVDVIRGPFDPGGQPDTRTGQPLELGFFAWNIKGGMTASKAVLSNPERLQNYWEWPNSMRLVQLAEEIGFDYQVPFGRWIGQGGETDYNGAALDFLASAAATAPVTKTLGLFSTAHITFRFHPLHIAKFGATIDHISNGRWGLNVVTGYSESEMRAFGFDKMIGHDEAYEMAEEFVCLMKHLWTEEERFDFHGKYYQAYGAFLAPKPRRKPRPILMNAGGSEAGIEFGVRNCDWLFTLAENTDGFRKKVDYIHDKAAKYDRDVRVATMCWVLPEATNAMAKEKYDWIASQIDVGAVESFLKSMKATSVHDTAAKSEMLERIALGITAPQIVGSYESCAEQLGELKKAGIESTLLCFFDPQEGLHQMQDHIIPIMKKMGLRKS